MCLLFVVLVCFVDLCNVFILSVLGLIAALLFGFLAASCLYFNSNLLFYSCGLERFTIILYRIECCFIVYLVGWVGWFACLLTLG